MKKLSKKTLRASWRRWLFENLSSFSFTWLQTYSFADSMVPVLEELYGDDKEELKKALERNSAFYNTEPVFGSVINGIVASMEEERANGHTEIDDEVINGLKAGLMGPLAGIGDSIKAGLFVPLILSIGIGLANGGNILGPIVYAALCLGVLVPLSYFIYMKGYTLGAKAIDLITGEAAKRITACFNILGAIVVGGVAAGNIFISSPLTFLLKNGETQVVVDNVLNGIFPKFLPLIAVVFCWWLMSKKKMSALKVMVVMLLVAVVGVFTGIL